MNARGHLWFSIMLEVFVLYVLKDFISLPFNFIVLHSIFYIIGATTILDYGFFDSYKKGIGHHGFWHSKKFIWLLILGLIPLSIHFYVNNPKYLIFGTSINIWSAMTFVFVGLVTHLLGDSLGSKLR